MDNLEINENNYKAYTELWLSRENSITGKSILAVLSSYLIVILSAMAFSYIINSFAALVGVFLLMVGVPFATVVSCESFQRRKINRNMKEKYPYIDTKISQNELYECLKKARIIVEDELSIDISVKRYEDILKYHKIQDQLLEEKKRDYYRLDYDNTISKEELEKVKIKVKTLVRNGKK